MQIIIPMAGIGERFIKAGYTDPKPLIMIDGKPVIEHIINMFTGDHEFIFICNENHIRETRLKDVLLSIKPDSKIISIPQHNFGPVYTLLQAKEYIKDDQPVITCYCDVNANLRIGDLVKYMEENKADAGLIAFKGFHPPLLQEGFYATARTDEKNCVLEVREKYSFTKNKMDSWTSAGIHYFKNGSIVKKYFEQLIQDKVTCNNEYYISLVHNLLIKDGLKNVLFPIDFFISWGKPEDVREYLYWSKYFRT